MPACAGTEPMTTTNEIWTLDLRGPINRKIEQAKKAGRGVTVSPYWLSKILARLDKHEPLKPCQHDLRLVKEKPCP